MHKQIITIPAGVITKSQVLMHDAAIVEYYIERDAQLTLVQEQNISLDDAYALKINFFMAPGSTLYYFPIILGARSSTLEIQITLHENAKAFVHGAYAIAGQQECTITTRQEHVGKHSESTLVINGIAHHKAQMRYEGIIAIQHEAARAQASQENKTILCSDGARALSIPSLEVLTNDVQCAHGSAVGPLQQELISYLQARGIPAVQAHSMLLKGFFEQTLSGLADEQEKAQFIEKLVAKADMHEEK